MDYLHDVYFSFLNGGSMFGLYFALFYLFNKYRNLRAKHLKQVFSRGSTKDLESLLKD